MLSKKCLGFSFLELLCCLILLGILLVASFPFSGSLLPRNQLEVLSNDVSNILRYARNKALFQEKNLVLSPLPYTSDWSKGMILFVDNETHRYRPKDIIIQRWDWNYPNISITWHGFQSEHYIIFPKDLKRAGMNGRFILSNNQGRKELVINRIGRIITTN